MASFKPSSAHAMHWREVPSSVSRFVTMNLKPTKVSISPCTSAFRTRYGFRRRRCRRLWSGLSLHLREMLPVKSLHLPIAGLGSGLAVKPSPNLSSFQHAVANMLGETHRVEICACNSSRVKKVFNLLRRDRNIPGYAGVNRCFIKNLLRGDQFCN